MEAATVDSCDLRVNMNPQQRHTSEWNAKATSFLGFCNAVIVIIIIRGRNHVLHCVQHVATTQS